VGERKTHLELVKLEKPSPPRVTLRIEPVNPSARSGPAMTFVLALSVGLLTKNVEILRFLVDVEVLSALDVRVDDGDEL
jgi:hypothetical protein